MHHNNFHRLYMQTSKENSQATCNTSLQHFLSPGCCRITRDWPFNSDAGIFIQSEIIIIIILWKTWKNSYSSDETRLAPPTLVTRCYVPHFHHYGDISIEILQIISDENNEDVNLWVRHFDNIYSRNTIDYNSLYISKKEKTDVSKPYLLLGVVKF